MGATDKSELKIIHEHDLYIFPAVSAGTVGLIVNGKMSRQLLAVLPGSPAYIRQSYIK